MFLLQIKKQGHGLGVLANRVLVSVPSPPHRVQISASKDEVMREHLFWRSPCCCGQR